MQDIKYQLRDLCVSASLRVKKSDKFTFPTVSGVWVGTKLKACARLGQRQVRQKNIFAPPTEVAKAPSAFICSVKLIGATAFRIFKMVALRAQKIAVPAE